MGFYPNDAWPTAAAASGFTATRVLASLSFGCARCTFAASGATVLCHPAIG